MLLNTVNSLTGLMLLIKQAGAEQAAEETLT